MILCDTGLFLALIDQADAFHLGALIHQGPHSGQPLSFKQN